MVAQQLKDFLALTERQFSTKLKTIQSYNGTEFMCLTQIFKEQGVVHETSCVHTPQKNRRADRKYRHILNVARTLRFQANLPIVFWGECVLAAGHLINRTPSSSARAEKAIQIITWPTSKIVAYPSIRMSRLCS